MHAWLHGRLVNQYGFAHEKMERQLLKKEIDIEPGSSVLCEQSKYFDRFRVNEMPRQNDQPSGPGLVQCEQLLTICYVDFPIRYSINRRHDSFY